MSQRSLIHVADAMPTTDGAGVSLKRALGTPRVDMVDPFLMLDEFRSDDPRDYIRGFPDHPHRGFETVTYMLDGAMEHRDSVGNRGLLGSGDVQWMTAGRGIIHSEMPRQREGLMRGFQLWVNLPASHKMIDPRYQDIPAAEIPRVDGDEGDFIKVIAGEYGGATGPVEGIVTKPLMLDVSLGGGRSRRFELPENHGAFIYVFEGEARIGEGEAASSLGTSQLGVLSEGQELRVAAHPETRFLLLAGAPIDEPVARYGPFVMNTREELEQAVLDYRSGRLTE